MPWAAKLEALLATALVCYQLCSNKICRLSSTHMQGEHATRGILMNIQQDKVISAAVVLALALVLALTLGITRRICNQTPKRATYLGESSGM
jgi:invasion protein IalB